jgi:hypothetical protein
VRSIATPLPHEICIATRLRRAAQRRRSIWSAATPSPEMSRVECRFRASSSRATARERPGTDFRRSREARVRDHQLLRAVRKAALGFNLQKVRDVFFGNLRQFYRECERPVHGQTDRAPSFANLFGIQLVADFATHQFNFGGERIKRERSDEGLFDLHGAIRPPHEHAVQPAAIERQPEQRIAGLPLEQFVQLFQINHGC